jgi:hypothetical protein
MWVDKSDEVIWTFALMIYLERAVLVCWQFMGFLYFEIPFFIRSFVFLFFTGLDVCLRYYVPYEGCCCTWKDITRHLSHDRVRFEHAAKLVPG